MSIEKALEQLRPNATWVIMGEPSYANLQWTDKNQSKPSKEEVEELANQIQQAWIDAEYQRLRKKEYPPLADLADALYWQSQGDESKMTAYLAAVNAVKVKYPKEGV
jgi:hypothetical protein